MTRVTPLVPLAAGLVEGSAMTAELWYLLLGSLLTVAGLTRMMLTRDLVARLIAMNVVGVGSLVVLLSLAARSHAIDPVLSALVITGLVITVAFTGVGAVLIRRIESPGTSRQPHGGEQE
ncbi:MAG TPA: NADH-quinone oxidoreductase subunit K [Candidatus Nesterenkonia stercoripullorum]|uniref:NADH-quinone oxidoreductase subunit K n=1 Tax=Candidatus Nesterenkonia stercoripullorum TaxID=2838701 RepID=A0A9D2A8F1_9MICC|nr:NADH-quinone oxidoreductase subunit K [Candidatus Nesterenkonia stercoripullorum]